MSDRYPILVDRWDAKHPSDTAVCERCHADFKWDPSEGDPYDLCATHDNGSGCGGQIVMKYTEGERCKACGKLDYEMPLSGCCSRKCMLQAEYAEILKAASS
jgi:hypothetical protein